VLPVLLGHKAQKREAARIAASLFWALICPDTSGESYKNWFFENKKCCSGFEIIAIATKP